MSRHAEIPANFYIEDEIEENELKRFIIKKWKHYTTKELWEQKN